MEEVSNSRTPRPHLTKQERLPQCYKDVEKVIRTVKSCQSNFKTVLANSRHRGAHFKKIYGMTVNVLKYYNYIQEILNRTHLLEKEKFLKQELASILIYEMIFGKGYIPGESKVVSVIRKYEKDIFNVHQMLENNIDTFLTKDVSVPRYVRVHTIVTTVAYVIKDLENLGFHQVSYDSDLTEAKYLELIRSLEPWSFLVDFHFKDMLVFEHGAKLIHLDVYKKGHIFLQDKASYIPVHALNPESGSAVLDACAAPGMKTVHIASKMKNKGILIACERDKNRFESLKEMIQYGSVKIAKVFCKDFRSLEPTDQAYSTIEYILLDPSCSGSGMVSRMDEVTDTEDSKNKERLLKLSGFQIILLKHALKFPSVKKVVYSTCSVHEEENESVVHEVLQQFKSTFKLVPVMPEWSERGLDSYEFGHLCLRTVPEKHMMNGFFVAMFERIESNDYGKYAKNRKFKMNSDALQQSHDFQNDSSLPSNTFEKEVSISNITIENDENLEKETLIKDIEEDSNISKKHKKKKRKEKDSVKTFSHSNEELINDETSLLTSKGISNENPEKVNHFDDESSVIVKHKKKNITIENDENLEKETLIKDIEHDSNVNKKHKKKKRKEEDSVKTFSHSNEELANDETSLLTSKDISNENSEKVNNFDHESNVIVKHKKKKRSKKSSCENCYSPKERTNEIIFSYKVSMVVDKLEKELATSDIEIESKMKKKHKRKKTREDSHESIADEELTNVLAIDESSTLANKANSSQKLEKETGVDQDTNVYKKHKKKKRRDDSLEILFPPSAELTNKLMGSETNSSVNLTKETATETFESDRNTSKKNKKKRKSKDSTEYFCEPSEESTNVLIANENSILNNNSNKNSEDEPVIEYFDCDSKVNKKHKKKKKKKDSTNICQPSEQHVTKLFENETQTLQVKGKHEKYTNFENINGEDVSTHKFKKRKRHSNHENDQ